MDIFQVIEQQVKIGRKETTKLTENGLEEINKFDMEFVSEDVKEIIEKSYGI